jgi:hypothetical protein
MEILLADIVLMNEIAVLAEQVEAVANVFDQTTDMSNADKKENGISAMSNNPKEIKPGKRNGSGLTEEEIMWSNISILKPSIVSRGDSNAMHDLSDNEKRESRLPSPGWGPQMLEQTRRNSSGSLAIKDLLDQWEDPVEAMNKKVSTKKVCHNDV